MCAGRDIRTSKPVLVIVLGCVLVACGSRDETAFPTVTSAGIPALTSDPFLAQTLQAETGATAVQIATLPAEATATTDSFVTLPAAEFVGTAPADRIGPCPIPEAYRHHDRELFCIAAPEAWQALNVDGGLAAALKTTPGHAITLQPDWADSTQQCRVLVYVASEPSAVEHLEARYAEFQTRPDLVMLDPVMLRSLAEMLLPGFIWESSTGDGGGIYASPLSQNRIAHINVGGSQCSVSELEPILATLRFDPEVR